MRLEDVAYISDEAADSLRGVTVESGDVLINITGDSIARCAVVVDGVLPARVSQHVSILRTTDDMIPGYLQRVLVNPKFKAHLLSISHGGGTRKALTKADLSNLQIPVPPIAVQQGIAEVLGALDVKIAANVALIAKADAYLDALAERMFAFCQEDVKLSEIADINAENIKPIPDGQLRYVDIASVGVGQFDYPDLTDWTDAPGRARRRIRRGDTLWSTVRPNRRSHALNLADDPAIVGSTGLAVLTPRRVGYSYLYQVAARPVFATYLESAAEGSAYPAVRADRFAEAPVPLAGAVAREEFETVAAPIREHIYSLGIESRRLAAIRDALLPALMSRDLRINDAGSNLK